MPRERRKKTSDVPTRIYSYRCLPPITEADRVEQQFKLAHQYRNALVEIDQRLRERFRAAQISHPSIGPALLAYEGAQADVDNCYDDLRAAKSGTASPDLDAPIERLDAAKELRAFWGEELRQAKLAASDRLRDEQLAHPILGPVLVAHKAAKTAVDEAKNADKETLKAAKEAYKAAGIALSNAKRDWRRDLRNPSADAALVFGYDDARDLSASEHKTSRGMFIERGLRTGTYDRVEIAIKQAVKTSRQPLHFERYDGTGSIGTQLIGDMTVTELLSCQDPRLRLGAPGEADAHPRPEVQGVSWVDVGKLGRNVRRHAARTYVDLRIGSNSDRSPIFARFPVTLHRSLPKDAVIKWAYVVRKRVGRHSEWRFQLTIESETFRPCPVALGEGTAAIDLGWRRLFDEEGNQIGLRVGYLVDETGREREIRAPEDMIGRMGKVYDLAAIRDKEFDAARNQLVTWLRDREVPAWMTDRITGLAQWRAPRKLAGLIDAWAGVDWTAWKAARATGRKCNPSDFTSTTNRIEGDKAILASLQAWAKQDRHLQDWQEHQRDRLIANRRETWRVLAAELTGRYATILIENGMNQDASMKLPDIEGWEQPAPEDGDPSDGREQRRMSRLAAPGELRAEILKAAPKRGARVEVEEAAHSTLECAWCSSIETFDAAKAIEHQCSSCGRTWDQDANACRNLLHRRGLSSGPVPPSGASSGPVPPSGAEVPEVPAEVPATPNLTVPRRNSGGAAQAVLDRVR